MKFLYLTKLTNFFFSFYNNFNKSSELFICLVNLLENEKKKIKSDSLAMMRLIERKIFLKKNFFF